jgi:hypothetical protein
MVNINLLIKRYRLVYISLLVFVMSLTWDMWTWYKLIALELEVAGAGGFSAAFISMIGIIKFALEGLRYDDKHD